MRSRDCGLIQARQRKRGNKARLHIPGRTQRPPGGPLSFIKKLTGASRGRGIVERLRGQGSVRMTTEEILNLTRGR